MISVLWVSDSTTAAASFGCFPTMHSVKFLKISRVFRSVPDAAMLGVAAAAQRRPSSGRYRIPAMVTLTMSMASRAKPKRRTVLFGGSRFWLADGLHQELVGSETRLVVVDLGGDDQLVGFGPGDELVELAPRRLRAADGGGREDGAEDRPRFHRQGVGVAGLGRRELGRMAGSKRDECLLDRSREQLGLFVAVGDDRVEAEHHVRLVELVRRLEAFAVERDRFHHHLRREVGGEGVRKPEHRRQL